MPYESPLSFTHVNTNGADRTHNNTVTRIFFILCKKTKQNSWSLILQLTEELWPPSRVLYCPRLEVEAVSPFFRLSLCVQSYLTTKHSWHSPADRQKASLPCRNNEALYGSGASVKLWFTRWMLSWTLFSLPHYAAIWPWCVRIHGRQQGKLKWPQRSCPHGDLFPVRHRRVSVWRCWQDTSGLSKGKMHLWHVGKVAN